MCWLVAEASGGSEIKLLQARKLTAQQVWTHPAALIRGDRTIEKKKKKY